MALKTIRLEEIGATGLHIAEALGDEALKTLLLGAREIHHVPGSGHVDLKLERVGEAVHVRGRMDLQIATPCARCLKSAEMALNLHVEIALFPERKLSQPGEDGELTSEDVSCGMYRDDKIELAALMREEVFLEIPPRVYCTKDCLGLCSTCGGDLNLQACACTPVGDPRWAGLAAYRKSNKSDENAN